MNPLPLPPFDAKSILELCAQTKEDLALRVRLLSVAEYVHRMADEYAGHARTATLYTVLSTDTVNGCVSTEEMKDLYDHTLVRLGSPARHIYDAIKLSAKLCPLCGVRGVSQLDHYLAKSGHPTHALSPFNLVPACSDCNKAKLDKQPASANEQTLHPYYDDIDGVVWLRAAVRETSPPAIEFQVVPIEGWSDITQQRVVHHFDTFRLASLYATFAAGHLVQMDLRLRTLAEQGGEEAILTYLSAEGTSSRAASRNSWQTAMFDALKESEWFRREGYLRIRPEGTGLQLLGVAQH